MLQKKGSKNAIENRGARQVDSRGELVMVILNGKKTMAFEKDGNYFVKSGVKVEV